MTFITRVNCHENEKAAVPIILHALRAIICFQSHANALLWSYNDTENLLTGTLLQSGLHRHSIHTSTSDDNGNQWYLGTLISHRFLATSIV